MRSGVVRPRNLHARTRTRDPHRNHLDHLASPLPSGARFARWTPNEINVKVEARDTALTFSGAIARLLYRKPVDPVTGMGDPPEAV